MFEDIGWSLLLLIGAPVVGLLIGGVWFQLVMLLDTLAQGI